jgi:N-acetylmuramoyl-L-alanine amidase
MQSWEVEGTQRQYSDRFSGFSLFVSRSNPRAAKSLTCASAIGQALRMAGRAPSLYHAEPIPGEDRPFADAENGVHYFDDLVVLKLASQPAVQLEAGVIVNRQEELLLERPQFRETIAAAVADGLARCLGAN